VGRGTAERDDPLLTARPPGPRRAVRIVLDSAASLSLDGQLVRTAAETPVLVAASRAAPAEKVNRLRAAAVEVWQSAAVEPDARLRDLLEELGRRQMTNLLVEGGSRVFGSLFDLGAIDEVHAFIAPRIVGGPAPTPVAGRGVASIFSAMSLIRRRCETVGDDLYVHGRVLRTNDS
jgi:diaminohydroxyphosphoribosylaminopyrimidine deaminase/5-amino-6-(5-phosphoribosylamino)uracil reductase